MTRPRTHREISCGRRPSFAREGASDEDFAETLAVWLAPRSNWARRYDDWQYNFDEVFYEMLARCRALELRAGGDPERLQRRFAILLRHHVKSPRQRRLRKVPV